LLNKHAALNNRLNVFYCEKNKNCYYNILVTGTLIKPGPAQWVDPEPDRPGGWTGPGLIKDRLWQQPDQTRATRQVDPGPGQTRTRPDLFFQMWDLKPISIYTLCSKKKVMFFQCGIKNLFVLNTST
jgi:hypothetical protein